MKRIILLTILLFSQFLTYSQEEVIVYTPNEDGTLYNEQEEEINELDYKMHEIKIGGAKLITGPVLELTYEFLYTTEFTFGSSILFNLENHSEFPENFSLTPFARFYFQERKEYGNTGFFVEGFGKFAVGKALVDYERFDNTVGMSEKNYNVTALGLSVGKKWVNYSGFVLEALAGLGRTFANSDYAPKYLPRIDLFIGYRF